MIRLFVAIDIPEHVKLQIRGMGSSIPNAKPAPKEQLHLTLKFIGEVESSMLLDIEEQLAYVEFQPLSLELKGVGTFPQRGKPNVIWGGVAPAPGLTNLRNSIEKSLHKIGILRDRKKFSPHITLARLKNSPIERVHNFLAGNSFFETPPFTVERFTLYSSQLTPKGALHTPIRSYFSSTQQG